VLAQIAFATSFVRRVRDNNLRPPRNEWPDSNSGRGILLFAQLMSEMLTPSTFESFRVFSLGTLARIDEAMELTEDVQRDRIPRVALEPPLSELMWSLTKDPVVESLLGPERSAFSELVKRKDYELSELRAHLNLIKRLLNDSYKQSLEKNIQKTFSDSQNRVELRQSAGFYCSHLVNLGYSKPFIAGHVEEQFFQRPMKRIGKRTLGRFFQTFNGKQKKFVCMLCLKMILARSRALLNSIFKIFPRYPSKHPKRCAFLKMKDVGILYSLIQRRPMTNTRRWPMSMKLLARCVL